MALLAQRPALYFPLAEPSSLSITRTSVPSSQYSSSFFIYFSSVFPIFHHFLVYSIQTYTGIYPSIFFASLATVHYTQTYICIFLYTYYLYSYTLFFSFIFYSRQLLELQLISVIQKPKRFSNFKFSPRSQSPRR